MNSIVKFFHEMLNPHCSQCEMDRQVGAINPYVETLKNELERSYRNNDKLLEMLFDKYEVSKEKDEEIRHPESVAKMPLPLPATGKSWNVRRRELEQARRDEARAMSDIQKQGITPITENDLEREIASVKENHA